MDQTTASYYRAILLIDSQDTTPLPPSLVRLHAWAVKKCQGMGLSATITKQSALAVAMMWLGSTKEGRAFARDNTPIGDMLCDDDEQESESVEIIDWASLPIDTKLSVTVDGKPTVGEYAGRRASWVLVKIGEESKPFKRSDVKLAGA